MGLRFFGREWVGFLGAGRGQGKGGERGGAYWVGLRVFRVGSGVVVGLGVFLGETCPCQRRLVPGAIAR